MNVDAAAGGAAADRRLVEDAVTMLLGEAPPGWARLHVEFVAEPAEASAALTTANGEPAPLPVPNEVIEALSEYHRQAAFSGSNWRRLVIDCAADGRLSTRTDRGASRGPRRWPRRLLAATTLTCLTAATVVFVVGWRWSPPPRADMIAVPPPSPRQQQVFEVMTRWYDAENRADGAALRKLACARPRAHVEDEITAFEQNGRFDGIAYLEAITGFRDEGAQVWAMIAIRVHPVSERQRQLSDETLKDGGFFFDAYTFVQEDGELKLCDADKAPLH